MKTLSKVLLTITLATLATGCNFFGKKEAEPSPPPGQLSNGLNVAGVWTRLYANTSATNNPTAAYSETYFLDPQGSARVEIKDPHNNGVTCIGYGQYRTVGNDIFLYIQATNYGFCGFASVSQLSNVKLHEASLEYHDNSYNSDFILFRNLAPTIQGPVGLWNFHGAGADQNGDGGFDWIFFTEYGYMVMQTTYDHTQYLLIGYYTVGSNGSLTVRFFEQDASQPLDPPIQFTQFITNGAVLDLSESSSSGTVHYTGDRL